jgi:hypothetical protein
MAVGGLNVATRLREICALLAHRRAARPDAASTARLISRSRFAPAARASSPLGDFARRDRAWNHEYPLAFGK